MGGMWSLYWFTMLTILKAAFWRDFVIARRTLRTSVLSQYMQSNMSQRVSYRVTVTIGVNVYRARASAQFNVPVSVRGVASVTSSVHCSQHISSSALPKKYVFLLFFSKNWTANCPLPLVCCELWIALTSAAVRFSISVSRSTSSIAGSVRSRRSRVSGDMDMKYRWKNIVWRIAIARSGVSGGPRVSKKDARFVKIV